MLRESKGFSKDHLTGVVKEVEKMKPVDALVRGRHNVKLFRKSDGVLVHEHDSENFVSVAWEDLQRTWAKMVLLASSFTNNGPSKDVETGYGLLTNTDANYSALFGHGVAYSPGLWENIYLSDYDAVERPLTERAFFGNMIGYAGRETTYSGASTQQGSFNAAESNKNLANKQFHFVWDFPTHAGNGTFQSLYWGYTTNNPLSPIPHAQPKITAPTGYKFDYAWAKGLVIKGNKMYVALRNVAVPSDRGIAVYDIDFATRSLTPSTVPVINIKHGDVSYPMTSFAIASDDTIYTQNYYEGRIRRFDPVTGNAINFPNGVASIVPANTDVSEQRAMWIDYTTDTLYTTWATTGGDAKYTNGAFGNFMVAINLATLEPQKTHKAIRTDSATYDINWSIPSIDYKTWETYDQAGTMAQVSIAGNSLADPFPKDAPRPIDTTYGIGTGEHIGLWKFKNALGEPELIQIAGYNNVDSVPVNFQNVGMIGGRNLLPEPITKTNEYTMKITYDLFFE